MKRRVEGRVSSDKWNVEDEVENEYWNDGMLNRSHVPSIQMSDLRFVRHDMMERRS